MFHLLSCHSVQGFERGIISHLVGQQFTNFNGLKTSVHRRFLEKYAGDQTITIARFVSPT